MARFKTYPSIAVTLFGLVSVASLPSAYSYNGAPGDTVSSSLISGSIVTDYLTAGVPGGLQFNLVDAPDGITAQVRSGFITAANYWSSLVADAGFTINLQIGFRDLGAGILGSTGSNQTQQNYSSFRDALITHKTSADDAAATNSLQSGSSFAMLLNGTSSDPNGSGSRTPYIDNDGDTNNMTIQMTTANARTLGLSVNYGTGDNSFDGLIAFSNRFTFDFDQSDGITLGSYDFIGVATHEIGHALGFISGINRLDTQNANNSYLRDDELANVSPVDLFRYTSVSAITTANGVTGIPNFTLGTYSPDFTPGNGTVGPIDQYFSLDNGKTSIASLSTGVNFGDGQQASHWKDNLNLGIMDPTSAQGELRRFSTNDLRLFDAIGYTLRPGALESVSAPEPGSLPLILLAGTLLIRRCRRRRGVK